MKLSALAAVVAAIFSFFGAHLPFTHSTAGAASPHPQTLHGGTAINPPPAHVEQSASAGAAITATGDLPPASSGATTTIVKQTINNPIVERVIERVVQTPNLSAPPYVTESELEAKLQALRQSLPLAVYSPTINFSGPAASTPLSIAAFAPSQRIDNLANVTITNASINGVSGLTDADIPDGITASNYLPLSGGTLAGDLSLSGTLTAGSLSVASVSSGGAVAAPYFTATSTATPSSFQQLLVNASTTLQSFTFVTATGTSATTTNFFATNASSTNLHTSNLFVGSLSGFLKATAGAIATALINLASDVTGVLPVANGGTGWANIAASAIPYGNGSGVLATTTSGTGGYVLSYLNGVPAWTPTTTLSTISGTLAVSSGGTGQTSFGQGWLNSNGTTLSASTSPTVNYITATSTAATSTFVGGATFATSAGNVGIGTTSPSRFKLQVLGNIGPDAANTYTNPPIV